MPAAPSAVDEATQISYPSVATEPSGPAGGIGPRGPRRRRIADLLASVIRTGYLDPLFERPDLVENDYYRFLNQPRD